MGSRNFRFNIVFRVALLIAFLFLLLWSLIVSGLKATPYICAVISVAIVIELIHYIERTNRKIRSSLDYIIHKDFSSIAVEKELGNSFGNLYDAFRKIADLFRRLNAEKAASTQYLELVVERINLALLCFDAEGKITLINRQAKRLFRSPYLPSINALRKIDDRLPEFIVNLKDNEQQLLAIDIDNEQLQLSVCATEFQLLGEYYKLISLQNIRDELEQHEIDSWQKLIHVLTHEIMNSVTPIISLTEVLKERLISDAHDNAVSDIFPAGDLLDVQNSIRSIESRSKGLHSFVQTYRRLASIPPANRKKVAVSSLLDNVSTLMLPEMKNRSILFDVEGNCESITVDVDPQQIEQVLINLLKNAMDALEETTSPRVELRIETESPDFVLLKIEDNGRGIEDDKLEQIFIPFFTTKHNGVGIGLSISRQIVIQNKGVISVTSTLGQGSTFVLRFRCS
jgi:two-component system nitrogen regulation sensor histidine kinase NtrY